MSPGKIFGFPTEQKVDLMQGKNVISQGKKTADLKEPRNDLKNSGRIMIGWLGILHEKLNAKI